MDETTDYGTPASAPVSEMTSGDARQTDVPEARQALVKRILKTIKDDEAHHKDAFERMRRDMEMARRGADKDWPKGFYVANLIGRHVNQRVAALYAKNPKAVARRRERLDYTIWDGNEQTLIMALQLVQSAQAQMMAATAGMMPGAGPMPGAGMTPGMAPAPMMPPGLDQALAILKDFQQGYERRQMLDRVGKTMEVLFTYYMQEQKPADFKTQMKQCVRRACTTSVGYVALGFQRKYEQRPDIAAQIADFSARLNHLRTLAERVGEGDVEATSAEMAELQASIQALQQEQFILVREGLVFDWPDSLSVIPDKRCRNLRGFVGADHLSVRYLLTCERVREIYGVDLKGQFTSYTLEGASKKDGSAAGSWQSGDTRSQAADLVCVYKHYDKVAGLMYVVADGYCDFLAEPGPPDVFVEDFWPVYALTFNDIEHDTELYPPSDVFLIADMQKEYNSSRQGLREHRRAARPRFATPQGMLEQEDVDKLQSAEPFEVLMLRSLQPTQKVADVLQAVPVPGVDPNIYETGPLFTDMQLVVGASEASFGMAGKATATGEGIAEASRGASTSSNVDDLDGFLTTIARAAGEIMLKEVSAETAKKIAGPGAVWPQMSVEQIVDEVFLEIEAGSMGKPNQAVEVQNWERMLPLLIQIPGINPKFLAKESLKRLDDRLDLTDAVAENIPAIVAMNRMSQPQPADPTAAPDQQGQEGGNKGPPPPGGPSGSLPPMGNNQV
jgi:hypothetical protein